MGSGQDKQDNSKDKVQRYRSRAENGQTTAHNTGSRVKLLWLIRSPLLYPAHTPVQPWISFPMSMITVFVKVFPVDMRAGTVVSGL